MLEATIETLSTGNPGSLVALETLAFLKAGIEEVLRDVGQADQRTDRLAGDDRAVRAFGLLDARRAVAAGRQRVQRRIESVDRPMTAGEELDRREAPVGEIGQEPSDGKGHVSRCRQAWTSSPTW